MLGSSLCMEPHQTPPSSLPLDQTMHQIVAGLESSKVDLGRGGDIHGPWDVLGEGLSVVSVC